MGIGNALARFEQNELGNIQSSSNRRSAVVTSANAAQDRLVDSLTAFSTKLAEDRIAESKQRIKEEVAEAKALAIEEDLEKIENEGLDPISQEDRESFDADKAHLQNGDKLAKQGARVALEQGETFDTSQKIAKLSGWALYAYTSQKASIAGDNYEAWVKGEMVNNGELDVTLNGETFKPNQAKTLEQKQAAMKALRQQFLLENELVGVRRELLAEKGGFYEKASKGHSTIMADYRKIDTIERSFEIKNGAIEEFKATKNYNQLYNTLLTTVDPETGKPLTRVEALDEVHNIIEEEMKLDKFQEEDLERLGNEDSGFVDKAGNPIKMKDKWPNRFAKLEKAMTDADEENWKQAEKKKNNAFKQDEATTLESIAELARTDPDKVDRTFLETKLAELHAGHAGFKSDKLENYIKYGAPNAQVLAIQKGQIEDLISKGELTPARLQQFDVRHQVTYAKQAELIGQINTQEKKVHLDRLKGMVEYSAKVGANDPKHHSVGDMSDYLQFKYREELAKAIAADDPNPSETAYQTALAWWKANELDLQDGEGFNVPGRPKAIDRKRNEKAIILEGRRQTKLLKQHGKGIIYNKETVNQLISVEELTEASNRYLESGRLGFDYPGEVDRYFRQYGNPKKGMGKFEIMNQMLKASGLPPLGKKPPSIEKIDQNTTKSEQVSLDTKNPWTSSRILGGIAFKSETPNVELVPNSSGEAVVAFSGESGYTFGESAGAYEFLLSNPTVAVNLGVQKEDLQPSSDSEPGGTGIKWSRLGSAITKLITSVDSTSLDTTDVMSQRLKESLSNNQEGIAEGLTGIMEALQTADTSDVLASQTREITSEDNLQWLSGILVDAAGQPTDTTEMISGQMTEGLNQLVNEILGDTVPLTDDQKNELATATYKYSGDPQDLNKTLRFK